MHLKLEREKWERQREEMRHREGSEKKRESIT